MHFRNVDFLVSVFGVPKVHSFWSYGSTICLQVVEPVMQFREDAPGQWAQGGFPRLLKCTAPIGLFRYAAGNEQFCRQAPAYKIDRLHA